MNRRYIDFVPVEKRKVPSPINKPAKKPVAKKPAVKKTEAEILLEEIPLEEMFAEKAEPAGTSTGLKSAKFGVIEDYRPKFVKTEVKKRPLGAKPDSGAKRTAIAVAKKPAVKPAAKPAVKPAIKTAAASSATKTAAKTKAPAGAIQANFINLNKIEKRPLSKNVYAKKPPVAPVAKKEESKKPTVIIAKPEKDSKVGMIVAVILTIILGAAAGTVAFLLLPK